MFVAYKNIVCTLKWPSLKAKIGKMKKSKFGRIDSWCQFFSFDNEADHLDIGSFVSTSSQKHCSAFVSISFFRLTILFPSFLSFCNHVSYISSSMFKANYQFFYSISLIPALFLIFTTLVQRWATFIGSLATFETKSIYLFWEFNSPFSKKAIILTGIFNVFILRYFANAPHVARRP